MTNKNDDTSANSLIALELDTGLREFWDIDELSKWLEEEKSFFSWLQTIGIRSEFFLYLSSQICAFFRSLQEKLLQ